MKPPKLALTRKSVNSFGARPAIFEIVRRQYSRVFDHFPAVGIGEWRVVQDEIRNRRRLPVIQIDLRRTEDLDDQGEVVRHGIVVVGRENNAKIGRDPFRLFKFEAGESATGSKGRNLRWQVRGKLSVASI